ncbi:glycosyltransferase [Halothiobacillus sp. DCM-1]|uniref:glycosyltransferase n=1 Tax=Halothiobacillus sp. DCM-1 TaxID=3112558 RepID=UPI0032496C18
MAGTAIVLPHREAFSADRPGAIALTVAMQLAASPDTASVWGDPLSAPVLVPAVHYLALDSRPGWPLRQSWRYRWAIQRAVRREAPTRLEIHNRAHLFHELSAQPVGLSLYLHNDPQSIRGLKTVGERGRVLARADYVVAVSDFIRQRFCAGLPAARCARVVTVPNTVDFTRFEPARPKQQEILFVGRLIPEKGALPLIQSLQEVLPDFPEWRARFIGAWHFGQTAPRYPHERELLAQVRPSLSERIQFVGYQSYDRVTEAFNQAAIVVVPSLWDEPFGRTALEGMAAGCAVIASNRGGLPEVLNETGLLVEPTAQALASALRRLMADETMRQQLGAQAAMRARAVFEPASIHQTIHRLRQG